MTFPAGVADTIHFDPYYIFFPAPPGSHGSCGIFARSTVPGISIKQTYGCTPLTCAVVPQGVRASVGDAYNPPFDRILQKDTDIYLVRANSPHVGSWGQRSNGQERIVLCE